MKRIIIIGATSGIGNEVAKIYVRQGWMVGVAGRRQELLETFQAMAPERIKIQALDVIREDAEQKLQALIEKTGGMDVFLLCSGVGSQNPLLQAGVEIDTARTNVEGFIRMVTAAFRYFRENGGGHLAAVSSIAGTKGLGAAPAYSATKRFQNTYLDALDQMAHMQKLRITFTDIRPGFVRTPLLKKQHYPMLMKPDYVAQHIVRALKNKKRRVVIDYRYALLVFVWKLVPMGLWKRLNIQNH